MRILGIVATPSAPSRTQTLVECVLAAAANEPAVRTELISMAGLDLRSADGRRAEQYEGDTGELLTAIDSADAIVFGMPVYRGSYPGSLKNLLDMVPRGRYDGNAQALRAKPVAVVATGASLHHFLAVDDLASVLRGFFAAYVVPPGTYAAHADFSDGRLVAPRVLEAAAQTGSALVALQRAVEGSPSLRAVEPQV